MIGRVFGEGSACATPADFFPTPHSHGTEGVCDGGGARTRRKCLSRP